MLCSTLICVCKIQRNMCLAPNSVPMHMYSYNQDIRYPKEDMIYLSYPSIHYQTNDHAM